MEHDAQAYSSQLIPYPGDTVPERHGWALGGHYRAQQWSEGAIAATLGILATALVGTMTSEGAALFGEADAYRLELLPFPGGDALANAYAEAGHFLFEVPTDEFGGALSTTLGALSAAFSGTTVPPIPAVGGNLDANLGALTASLSGTTLYDFFFEVEYSVTPTFLFTVMPQRSGSVTAVLGSLASLLRGVALPPDSTDGLIAASLSALTASFTGTFTPAPGRSGFIHGDLSDLVASFRGAAVPPQGVQGGIEASLGALSASMRGTFTPWATDGRIAITLGSLSASVRGQSFAIGTIVGKIDTLLAPLSAALQGTVVAPEVGYLTGTVEIVPALIGIPEISTMLMGEPNLSPEEDA